MGSVVPTLSLMGEVGLLLGGEEGEPKGEEGRGGDGDQEVDEKVAVDVREVGVPVVESGEGLALGDDRLGFHCGCGERL